MRSLYGMPSQHYTKRIMIVYFIVCIFLLSTVASTESMSAKIDSHRESNHPWECFHGDARHTGLSEYNTTGTRYSVLWKYKTGAGIGSSPVIDSEGTIYIGSDDGYIYALYPNGTLKWKYKTGRAVTSAPAIGADGTIYVGSSDYFLYALRINGTLKWRVRAEGAFGSPTIASDGTVYVGSLDAYIYAIKPNGRVRWKYKTGWGIASSPAIGPDGTVYIGSDDKHLYAMSPSGTLKWKIKLGDVVKSSPAVDNNGTIYVGCHDGFLYAFYPDGSIKWKYDAGGALYSSPAIGPDGTIYIGSLDSNVYAVRPNGTLKWKFMNCTWTIISSPCVSGNSVIYVGSEDSYFYAINPDGKLRWKYKTDDGISSSPAIGQNGTIYFGSSDGHVYALGERTSPGNNIEILDIYFDNKYVRIGEDVNVTAIIKNDDTVMAESATVEFYVDDEEIPQKRETVGPLDIGETTEVSFVLHTSTLLPGNHTVRLKAGENERVSENITVLGIPHPYISYIEILPEKVYEGENVSISIIVENNGTANAENVVVKTYIDNNLFKSESVNVSVNEMKKLTYQWTAPDVNEIKNFEVKAVAGTSSSVKNLTVIPKVPDIVIKSLEVQPEEVYEGDMINITVVLKNNGTADGHNISIKIYADEDLLITKKATVKVGEDVIIFYRWSTLEVSEDTLRKIRVVVGDKEACRNITVLNRAPILKITNISISPEDIKNGDIIYVEAVIENVGVADAEDVIIEIYDGMVKKMSVIVSIPMGEKNVTNTSFKVEGAGKHSISVKLRYRYMREYLCIREEIINVLPMSAKIVISNFTANPKQLRDKPKDSVQKVILTVILENEGETNGTISVKIKEDKKTHMDIIAEDIVNVSGGQKVIKTYEWLISGEGMHRAIAVISGDIGKVFEKDVYVQLTYSPPTVPYLETIFIILSFLFAMIIRKK